MKRTYYTAAIAATLVLGSICSTTLAGNKHGSQGARSFNHGGSSNNSKQSFSSNSVGRNSVGRAKVQYLGGGHPPEPIKSGGQKFQKVQNLGTQPANPVVVGRHPPEPTFKRTQSSSQLIFKSSQSNSARSLISSTIGGKPPTASIVDPKVAKCIKPGCPPYDPCCKPANCSPCKPYCGPGFPWPWPTCYPCDPCCKPIIITCPTYCDPYCQTVVYSQPAVTQVVVKEVEKLMQVPVGSTLVLQAQNLGTNAGQVMLQVDKVGLGALVNEWKNESVNTTLPMLGIAGPTPAQIVIFKADGSVASSLNVELIPAQPQAAAAVATTAVQVTK